MWSDSDERGVYKTYHVSVDMDLPYHVYGGLQDNSSWVGDSQYPGGITNSRWENMYGGDGFWMFADPSDPDYIYAEFQGGGISRINRKTHESRNIQPLPQYKEGKLRYNWNTPIHLSPTQKGTIYIGAQFLFRSRDRGQTWERISPDLTTNDPNKQKQEQSGGVTGDTTLLQVVPDPRSKHTPADRKAQFDLAQKLYNLLGSMTFATERINGVRLALEDRAAKLPVGDPLAKRLQAASAAVDELRKKIVATKEGGAITGEERLREFLSDLYGNVNFYEGRPSQTQAERADALARELADVVQSFDAWLAKELAVLNSEITKKQLEPIAPLTRDAWEKQDQK